MNAPYPVTSKMVTMVIVSTNRMKVDKLSLIGSIPSGGDLSLQYLVISSERMTDAL